MRKIAAVVELCLELLTPQEIPPDRMSDMECMRCEYDLVHRILHTTGVEQTFLSHLLRKLDTTKKYSIHVHLSKLVDVSRLRMSMNGVIGQHCWFN